MLLITQRKVEKIFNLLMLNVDSRRLRQITIIMLSQLYNNNNNIFAMIIIVIKLMIIKFVIKKNICALLNKIMRYII